MSAGLRCLALAVLGAVVGLAAPTDAASKPAVPNFTFVKHGGSCATVGSRIDVRGSGFGKKGRYQLAARNLSGQPALATSSWSDGAIVALVPTAAAGSKVVLGLRDAKGVYRGNTASFTACSGASGAAGAPGLTPLSHGFGRSMVPPPTTVPSTTKPAGSGRRGARKPPAPTPLGKPPATPGATPTRVGPANAADPGEGPEEIVVLLRSERSRLADTPAAQDGGLGTLRERHVLGSLGLALEVRSLAPGTDLQETLRRLRRLPEVLAADPNARLELLAGTGLAPDADDAKRYASGMIGWAGAARRCGEGLRIGLVDTGVDLTHPRLRGARVRARSFATPPSGKQHATAIAGLLVGGPESLLPDAELWVAETVAAEGAADPKASIDAVARGLDWLVGEDLGVINMSLGGPRNAVLAEVLRRVLEGGVHVVAAAGNGGPQAAPVHPAAQPGVIAVAAVDARKRLWRHSNRGRYVDLVAPGVDLWVARPGGDEAYVSGTSFAAPFVAAALAVEGPEADLERVLGAAEDLGEPGPDPVYGRGLLRAPAACGSGSAGRATARSE